MRHLNATNGENPVVQVFNWNNLVVIIHFRAFYERLPLLAK